MKIVVFTYDRTETATTPNALEAAGLDYLVVCHEESKRKEYLKNGTVDRGGRIVASGVPKGLANNRNWYLDEHLEFGEWCLMLVDDWIKCTELEGYDEERRTELPITTKNSSQWSAKFKREIGIEQFYDRALELRKEAERIGCDLAGFAGYTNALFRRKHWARNVLADGRAWVMRKTGLKFDPNVQMVDDMCFCAQNILCGGGTLVNQWVLPECKRYTAGAFGSIDQRMEQKIRECAYLTVMYPGLVRYAPKKGWPEGSHVKLIPSPPKRVARLRREYAERAGQL